MTTARLSANDISTASEEQQLRTAFLRLNALANALQNAAETATASARHAYAVIERDAARALHRAQHRVAAEAGEAYENVQTVLTSRAERLAPGLAGMEFDQPAWRSGEWLGASARYVRIGTLAPNPRETEHVRPRLPELPVVPTQTPEPPTGIPALAPLLDTGNISLSAAPDEPWLIGALHGLLLRALISAPPGRLEIVVFDPKIRGILSPFSGLRKALAELFAEPIATPSDLLTRLQDARDGALRVAEQAGLHDAADLSELRSLTGTQIEPYRVFVILDYPYGLDSRTHAELLRIAAAAPRRGVSLLVHHDPQLALTSTDAPIDPAPLLGHTTVIQAVSVAGHLGLSSSGLPDVVITPGLPPSRDLIELVTAQVATAAIQGAAPIVEFRDLLPAPDHHWQEDATDGVIAPIGKAGLETVAVQLRGADPALPNVLIGGASGQGKSNLLLVLLHSIAAAYSPADVEMYLLDFKDGLEFDRLGPSTNRPHWMPHVKVLGLEGDRLFGLAVLRHIDEEFRRRAAQFRSGDANSIGAYRRQHPDEKVPRIVLVIDEFQVLIADSDDIGREAIAILETLARRGRAVGVHLILASQTLSGIDTLASKERSIFGQFPWRISLKTEAGESEAILGRGNAAAAGLRYRGEAILNSDYGAVEQNRRAVVAFAEERQLDRLRATLWARWIDQSGQLAIHTPPRIFYASRPADPSQLPDAMHRLGTPEGARLAVLGMPVAVDPAPVTFSLSSDPGRTLAIIGDGRDDALGVLSSAAWSLATQHPGQSAEFVLLDGLNAGRSATVELEVLADLLVADGHAVSVRDNGEVGQALIELGQLVDDRLGDPDNPRPSLDGQRAVYVLGAGLHRAPRLQQVSMGGLSPAHSLQRIVRDGPLADVYLLGWWNTLRIFNEHLGYEVAPLVGGAMFLRAPENDVQALGGPYIRYQARPHRGLFIDRTAGAEPVPVVPFRSWQPGESFRA